MMASNIPFLRIPPFPGAVPKPLAQPGDDQGLSDSDLDRLITRLAELRAGGTYWASHPPVPKAPFLVVRVSDPALRREFGNPAGNPVAMFAAQDADPWHLVAGAAEVVADAGDEILLVAALCGVPVRCIGEGRFAALAAGGRTALREALRTAVTRWDYRDPFTGEPIDAAAAVELCGFWRKLIHSNRDIDACVGFAFWKRPTTAPLLWGGQAQVPFKRSARGLQAGQNIAIWKSRTPPRTLARLEQLGARLIEVEDGFIRSAGLGADCVAPLSIVVDRSGIYFDPRTPSDLERLIADTNMAPDLLERAARLRQAIVEQGISKYEGGGARLERRHHMRPHLLVPGQVEDDRSVMTGGGSVATNLELLRRVRAGAPDAYLIYKPHPDVEAGHRRGAIPDQLVLGLADEVLRDVPISAAIELADEVHVNTSLAGFEALLRAKSVTTYGVPFYAGWGLTQDLGDVPARRHRRRTVDELVAAALLLYPRYLDPLSNLPCPPEILIRQVSSRPKSAPSGALVRLRQIQGRLKRLLPSRRTR